MSAPDYNNEKQRVICVYCGSSSGKSPAHLEAARALAQAFHKNNIKLVYGGGTWGLMGELAKTLVALSGPDAVFGVIPEKLVEYERAETGTFNEANKGTVSGEHSRISPAHEAVFGRTVLVPDMHSRKQLMVKKVMEGGPGSGFVALSGGYGTMEEFMEATTWNQLGIQARGVCVFNVDGFYDGLLRWIEQSLVGEGFVSLNNWSIIVEARTADEVIKKLAEYELSQGRFDLDWSEI